MHEVASLDAMESLVRALLGGIAQALYDVWEQVVQQRGIELGGTCPSCAGRRKVKRRAKAPMQVRVLGLTVEVSKLYLECDCGAPGLSVTRLLTGLSHGDASAELELTAGYCGAEHSYSKASRDLQVHHGQSVERTHVRRMALQVEREAVAFAESQRLEVLAELAHEGRREGAAQLMMQGDGGIIRTGTLRPCEPGEPGYGQETAKTGRPRQKRDTQYRELITLDVRAPGQMTSCALDVVVPVVAAEGERARRMLALAARRGLGDNTEVFGLGDMGSSLADSFDEAFVGHTAMYCADWKHTIDYVDKAASVLAQRQPQRWAKAMKGALWNRERKKVQRLMARARERRVESLPQHLDKCPVQALGTYVENNWERLKAKEFKERELDFVSARAEAQVRDRTKSRFAVPGAWRHENLEGKATLRAMIADGRWPGFREHYLRAGRERFAEQLEQRLRAAVQQGRLSPACSPMITPSQQVAAPSIPHAA